MSFYNESITKILREKIAYFSNAGLEKEASLLQARLNAFEDKPAETSAETPLKTRTANPVAETACKNLRSKLTAETARYPELEKQYILENLNKAKTLKELEPLRVAYINRLVKISRASQSKNITSSFGGNAETDTGPYNNEKIFREALQLIYSQDPLWIEDLKELYGSIG